MPLRKRNIYPLQRSRECLSITDSAYCIEYFTKKEILCLRNIDIQLISQDVFVVMTNNNLTYLDTYTVSIHRTETVDRNKRLFALPWPTMHMHFRITQRNILLHAGASSIQLCTTSCVPGLYPHCSLKLTYVSKNHHPPTQ